MERVLRRLRFLLLGLALTLVLTGCPYSSEVPLKTPSTPINPYLLGNWREESSAPSPIYNVQPDGEFRYLVTAKSDSGTIRYHAHLTTVSGRTYLNLLQDEPGSKYLLFELEIGSGDASFLLHPVTENITERFNRPEELFAFVEKNQGLSFFFESPTRYVHPVSP